jgi:hypothetical protein
MEILPHRQAAQDRGCCDHASLMHIIGGPSSKTPSPERTPSRATAPSAPRAPADVRSGSKSELRDPTAQCLFYLRQNCCGWRTSALAIPMSALPADSGHRRPWVPSPLCAVNGLMHRSNLPLHSINLSARSKMDVATSILSAFAVLRLTTSSNFVGCSTGRSAGFSPRKTRSA